MIDFAYGCGTIPWDMNVATFPTDIDFPPLNNHQETKVPLLRTGPWRLLGQPCWNFDQMDLAKVLLRLPWHLRVGVYYSHGMFRSYSSHSSLIHPPDFPFFLSPLLCCSLSLGLDIDDSSTDEQPQLLIHGTLTSCEPLYYPLPTANPSLTKAETNLFPGFLSSNTIS